LQQEKVKLQEEIIARNGVDDELLWQKLKDVRKNIESLYEEKLMLVRKLFNLS
jgi:hypothetical protein